MGHPLPRFECLLGWVTRTAPVPVAGRGGGCGLLGFRALWPEAEWAHGHMYLPPSMSKTTEDGVMVSQQRSSAGEGESGPELQPSHCCTCGIEQAESRSPQFSEVEVSAFLWVAAGVLGPVATIVTSWMLLIGPLAHKTAGLDVWALLQPRTWPCCYSGTCNTAVLPVSI